MKKKVRVARDSVTGEIVEMIEQEEIVDEEVIDPETGEVRII